MSTTRRKFSPEFKLEAVRLVTDQGQTIAEVARQLGRERAPGARFQVGEPFANSCSTKGLSPP
ncbi:MAG: transposase [Chloroflexi bacterium]|nr:transposase [Chloroflexota bacterium]